MNARFTHRIALRALAGSGLVLALAPAALAQEAPAQAPQQSPERSRTEFVPYLEVQQVLNAELGDDGDVLTYTAVAAGVDASVQTNRVEAQVSYRYERRIPWESDLVDEDVHSGLAQVRAEVIDNTLSIDAGAIAARSRIDQGGPAPGFTSADSSNVAEVYGAYAGPSLTTHAGDVDISANYRLGYVKVGDGEEIDLPPGTPRLSDYDSSVSHSAFVSAGVAPGRVAPVGVTASAGYGREEVDTLDQEYEGKFVRGDAVLPISSTLAVTAGAGYEKIKISQQDVARNSDGSVVVSPDGELVADENAPRLLAYDTSGLIWDAGVIWRPTRRTELQARVGQRYGGTTYSGSLHHQFSSASGLTIIVYDSVSSFGRLLINDLSGLPVGFDVNRGGLNSGVGGIGGCVFGSDPGSGGCFDDVFQSTNATSFRNRGVSALLSGERGPWDFGLGAGYNRRKYLAPDYGNSLSLRGVVDESVVVYANASRDLSRNSQISFDAYASWFDSGFQGSGSATSTGLTGSYYRTFLLDRLQGQVALGVYTTDAGDEDSTVASGLVGLRYNFF